MSATYTLYKNHSPTSENEYSTLAAALLDVGFVPGVPSVLDWDVDKFSDPEIPGHLSFRIKIYRAADGIWRTKNPYDTGTPVEHGTGEDGLDAAEAYVTSQD